MTCCIPAPAGSQAAAPVAVRASGPRPDLVQIAGGQFLMGGAGPMVLPSDGEGPVRPAEVAPFAIAPLTVTSADFLMFVLDTGHVTQAERLGSSLVFAGYLPPELAATAPVASPPWWREVAGACWLRPQGPGSDIARRLHHPVVHVSWSDAMAYASWCGSRLPTEEEWEFAARGGLAGKLYPWGDDLTPGGQHQCNIWQGAFPQTDLALDGFAGTAPARHYAPNGHGLYQMTGNVWEWCLRPAHDRPAPDPLRPLRGGSHLCHASYCTRYRVSARQLAQADITTSHIGFRLASDHS